MTLAVELPGIHLTLTLNGMNILGEFYLTKWKLENWLHQRLPAGIKMCRQMKATPFTLQAPITTPTYLSLIPLDPTRQKILSHPIAC